MMQNLKMLQSLALCQDPSVQSNQRVALEDCSENFCTEQKNTADDEFVTTEIDFDSENRFADDVISRGDVLTKRVEDIQGILWENCMFDRDRYRVVRSERYKNFFTFGNLELAAQSESPFEKAFFDFECFNKRAKPTISHFQLRHLVKCISCTDVAFVNNNSVQRLCVLNDKCTDIMDLNETSSLQSIQISTMTVSESGLVVIVSVILAIEISYVMNLKLGRTPW
jgi:hypothetical protein